MTNEQRIWQYFISKGINEYGVAGLMGNLQAESGLRSNNLQNTSEKRLGMTDEEYTLVVDTNMYNNFVFDSAGYGIAQWTTSGRKQGLLNLAKQYGCSIGDLNMQLDYLWYELNNGYKNVLSAIKSATSVKDASDVVLLKFEAPKIKTDAVKNLRASYGQDIYNKYAKVIIRDNDMDRIIIGSARQNELGKYVGGLPGDQTGKEVMTQEFYQCKSGWFALRLKNAIEAKALAQAMLDACYNNNIGYCQDDRLGVIEMLRKYGKLKNIAEPTEADCSSLVRACLMEVGICVGNFNTSTDSTYGEVAVLSKSGHFEPVITVMSPADLCTGDIIVTRQKGHTAIVVQGKDRNGGSAKISPVFVVGRTYTLNVELNVRTAPSVSAPKVGYENLTDNAKASDKDKNGCLDKGTRVTCREIREISKDIWMKIPSGWIAAYYQGKMYLS